MEQALTQREKFLENPPQIFSECLLLNHKALDYQNFSDNCHSHLPKAPALNLSIVMVNSL